MAEVDPSWDDAPRLSPKDEWDALPRLPEPVPQPYMERVAHGEAVKNAFEEQLAKPYSERIKEWAAAHGDFPSMALGATAATIAGIPEMVARGVTTAGDALSGHILTGPGLRREDVTDEPSVSWHRQEPLDTLFQRAQDMAMSGGVGESAVPRVTLEGRTPLLLQKNGTTVRPFTDVEGTVRGHVVGTTPSPADFENAATVIAGRPSAETENLLRQQWREEGKHPSEVAYDAQGDLFLRNDLTAEQTPPLKLSPADEEALTITGGKPVELSAAATDPPTDIPLSVAPAAAPGRLTAAIQSASDKLFDAVHDAQMAITPMVRGTAEAQAIAKDFANNLRKNRWDWGRIDDATAKQFTAEQRKRMWDAADEESVLRQEGKESEFMGLATLTPEERAWVENLQTRAQVAWAKARDLEMVEGEGLPAYTPRMVANVASAISGDKAIPLNGLGRNLWTRTAQMKHRKHFTAEETEAAAKKVLGETAELVRDIRVLPMATAKLEDAIAGRTLINAIKDYGKRTGEDTVAEGGKPAGSKESWFTIDHPAFKTWRPQYERNLDGTIKLSEEGKVSVRMDKEGNPIFEQVPIYVHGDFEGPLRAVLTGKSGVIYQGAMAIKGKTMGLIMNSPMIHNMVEFGRAFPAMPLRMYKVYFDGNRAKYNVPLMHEAIDAGLVPIGKRFFNQDINSILEEPNLTPGRSWTAKVLGETVGRLPQKGMTTEEVMNQVKADVDKAGDFWHNTLLWDRIADLQMGLYVNLRGDLMAKGINQRVSSIVAAHFANRYAGALPREAMSEAATKAANLMLFSRSFTIGNVGVIKDALTGLPQDLMAQIEREMGTVDPAAAGYAKALARRKAFAVVAMDIGLLYVANSLVQNILNTMLMDSSLDKEMHGYVRRTQELMQQAEMHPLELLSPMTIGGAVAGGVMSGPAGALAGAIGGTALTTLGRLSSTYENEPSKRDRLHIGYAKDGTAIYARSPFGKIGEEFLGYLNGPIDILKRKEGTIARPLLQVQANDKGFGRKVYDPNAETPAARANAMFQIIEHIAKAQTPEGQVQALGDVLRGDGDPKVNKLQAFGPIAGVTFSKGAPGGPAMGEVFASRAEHQYAIDTAMPGIKKQILRGELQEAMKVMQGLHMSPSYQRFVIRTTQNPSIRLGSKTTREFLQYATPEQRDRFERALERQPGPLAPPEQ